MSFVTHQPDATSRFGDVSHARNVRTRKSAGEKVL